MRFSLTEGAYVLNVSTHYIMCKSKSSSRLGIHPASAASLTYSLTFLRSSRTVALFSSAYVELLRLSTSNGIARRANVSMTSLEVLSLHTALPPFRSVCLRPCKTPLINVSCCCLVQSTEIFDGFGFAGCDPDRRLEYSNLRCVVLILNGRYE